MSPLSIAWRNLRTRPLQTALTALIIALGVGLALAVVVLSAGLRRGLTSAGGPFELVVGLKGSPTQLVVSSVLLQDAPIGNMRYAEYERLRADPRVRDAVPLALGDNLGGLRIVGTTPALFEVTVAPGRPPFYRLAAGRVFGGDFEAVLGSQAARRLGLGLDAQFVSAHGALGGVNQASHAGFPYRVVGLLAPSGTPADLGIYVPLSSYWRVHGAEPPEPGHADTHEAGPDGVTAVLVRGRDISASYQLYQQLNAGERLQAALPGAVLTQLLALLGQGQRALALVTYVALGMAGLSSALSLYGALLARRRDTAVLRALGASRRTVLLVALLETLLQSLLGLGGGCLLGHAAAALLAALIVQQSAVAVPLGLEPVEGLILAAMLLAGLAAGLLPALQAYRQEPTQALSSDPA